MRLPVQKDMIEVTDTDFKVVNIISIAAIFLIIAFVTKSISLPIILVALIEFAIFINLGLPHYLGQSLPFIAPICISTIQLGATVDYAILMTTRYKKERAQGREKRQAVSIALSTSIPSVIVSALGLFAATFGVALYSNVDMISALCKLMARGAIVSMFCVILILPAMFMLFDKVICATSIGFKPRKKKRKHVRFRFGGTIMKIFEKKPARVTAFVLSLALVCSCVGISAYAAGISKKTSRKMQIPVLPAHLPDFRELWQGRTKQFMSLLPQTVLPKK